MDSLGMSDDNSAEADKQDGSFPSFPPISEKGVYRESIQDIRSLTYSLIGIGALAFIYGVVTLFSQALFLRNAVEVKGVEMYLGERLESLPAGVKLGDSVHWSMRCEALGEYCYRSIQYPTSGGESIFWQSDSAESVLNKNFNRAGETISIWYDQRNPARFEKDVSLTLWLSPILFTLFGLLVISLGVCAELEIGVGPTLVNDLRIWLNKFLGG